MPKPIGSGYFSAFIGLLFLAAFGSSFVVDLSNVDPQIVLRVWFGFAALVLISWGAARLKTANPKDRRIGQPTLNFVVGIIGATIALLALIRQ